MRIDLNAIPREHFLVNEHTVAGETMYLVQPNHIGAKYTPDTLIYRSSLWNAEGELVSPSYVKFFNWGEQPDLTPHPTVLDDTVDVIAKEDGSTLIMSKYKGVRINRTRGTVDATKLDNGDEVATLLARYPEIEGFFTGAETVNMTLLWEWVTPRNQIVIAYPEPDLILIGIIDHVDYSLWTQEALDHAARRLGVKRPKRYRFNTIPEMTEAVHALKDSEGVCVYFNGGQHIRKLKSLSYLARHRFKERVSVDSLLDLWFAQGCPDLTTFEATLAQDFDWECSAMALPIGTRICEAHLNVLAALRATEQKVKPLRALPRRDAALAIQAQIPKLYQSVAFNMLSGKPVDPKQVRRLMEWELCPQTPVSEPATP